MKIVDQTYSCPVSSFIFGCRRLQCRLRIFQPHPEVRLVMLTDIRFRIRWLMPGLIEQMANQVVQRFQLDPAHLIWVEPSPHILHPLTIADFDQIAFDTWHGKATNPQRIPITLPLVHVLLNESLQLLEEVF
jgi:hypothetical protein